jgi:thymidine phosphorylase
MERPDHHLAVAPVIEAVPASHDGFIAEIDTRALGFAVVALGGGRTAPGQAVDPAVGLDRLASLAAPVRMGEPLARVHAANRDAARQAARAVARAYVIGDAPPALPTLVERIELPA